MLHYARHARGFQPLRATAARIGSRRDIRVSDNTDTTFSDFGGGDFVGLPGTGTARSVPYESVELAPYARARFVDFVRDIGARDE